MAEATTNSVSTSQTVVKHSDEPAGEKVPGEHAVQNRAGDVVEPAEHVKEHSEMETAPMGGCRGRYLPATQT